MSKQVGVQGIPPKNVKTSQGNSFVFIYDRPQMARFYTKMGCKLGKSRGIAMRKLQSKRVG